MEEPDWAGIEGQVEQGPVGDSTVTESDGKDAQEQRKTRGVQTPENSRTERCEQAQPVYTSEKAEQRRRQASEPSQVGYGTLLQGLLGARLRWDLTVGTVPTSPS